MIRTGYERLLVLVPLLGGCPIVEDLLGDGPTEEKESVTTDDRDPTRRIDEKLSSYLGCRDSLESPINESWARYTEHVDESGNPRRRNRAFIYPVGKASFRICNEVLAEAPERPPSMPEIERAATEMVEAAREYAQLSRELSVYFESGEFQEDGAKKLTTLHPRLVDARSRWARTDAVLELYLDTEKTANDPKLLEILSEDGKNLEYHARALMVRARPLARCFRRPEATAEECQALFADFSAAYQAFETAHAAERETAEHVFWMTTFTADAAEFHAKAREHASKMGDKRGRESEEVLLVYKDLVRDASTLDFGFP